MLKNSVKQIFWKFWEISDDYLAEGKRLEKAKKSKTK